MTDGGDEDVEGELGLLVAFGGGILDVAEVVEAAEAEQAGLVGQGFEDLFDASGRFRGG